MPRFFFHVFDHPNEIDCEGTVLEHAEEARKQAVAYASEILDGKRDTVRPGEAWHMQVTDEHNAPMFRLDFSITDTSTHGMVSEVA